MERFMEEFSRNYGEGFGNPAPIHAHRAPDLPVPVDEPVPEPHHPHHPDAPVEQDDPVPDRNPE